MVSYKKKRGAQGSTSQGFAASRTTTKFKASSSGYKDIYFTSGYTQDIMEFIGTHQTLACYAAMSSWKYALVLAIIMTKLGDTGLWAPARVYAPHPLSTFTLTIADLYLGWCLVFKIERRWY